MTDLWLRCVAWMKWCFFPPPSFNLPLGGVVQGRRDLVAQRPVMCVAQRIFCLLGKGEKKGRAPRTMQPSFSRSQQSLMNAQM